MKASKKSKKGKIRTRKTKAASRASEEPQRKSAQKKAMTATSVKDERTGEYRMLVRFSHTHGRRETAVLDEALIVDRKQFKGELRRKGADLPKTARSLTASSIA